MNPKSKRFKPRKGWPYCERHHELGYSALRTENKMICRKCRHILPHGLKFDQTNCPECGSSDVRKIGPIARLPRKNAAKAKWDEFWKHCGRRCARGCR